MNQAFIFVLSPAFLLIGSPGEIGLGLVVGLIETLALAGVAVILFVYQVLHRKRYAGA
jgi:ABC-type Co2+ transport system permease subunit